MTQATPLAVAMQTLRKGRPDLSFEIMLAKYMQSGFVYCGPDAFLMAHETEDCWWVQLAAGNVRRLFELAPRPKPWVAWQRGARGDLRVHKWPWKALQRRISARKESHVPKL